MSTEGTEEGWSDAQAEEVILRELLVPLAQSRLEVQAGDVDAVDTKAMGALTLVAAAIGVLVAVHDVVNHLWQLPMIGCSVSGVLLLISLWPRYFEPGVVLKDFYSAMSGSTPLEAFRQMLAELLACEERNNQPLGQKILLFQWGFGLLILSLIGIIPVALIRP